MKKQYFIIISVTFLLVNYVKILNGQRDVGDSCVVTRTGAPGVCKKLIDCEQARTALQQSQVIPQICDYEGTLPIICCVESEDSSQPSRPNSTSTSRLSHSLPAQPNLPSQPGSSPPSPSPSRIPGLISKEKCKVYAKLIEIEPKDSKSQSEEAEIKRTCSFEIVTHLIPSPKGEAASPHEFPHMALIGTDSTEGKVWFCAGSLISDRYVLTAGHCLYSRRHGKPKYVSLGIKVHDRDNRQFFRIEEMFSPEGFEPLSHYDDIALLKLDKRVDMGPYVRPACLYAEKELATAKAIASSWGRTSYFGSDSDSGELLKFTLTFFDHATCNESYKNYIGRNLMKGIIDDTQVCAGLNPDSRDYSCYRDSGSPTQIYSPEEELFCTYKIVGVASFGKYCILYKDNPTVHTRVSGYIKWIEDIVWPN